MIIDINVVNADTRKQYELLQKQVEDLIQKYQQEDGERLSSVMKKIEQTNGDWDKAITLRDGDKIAEIPILQVIAYEYCLATEKITEGRVDFETMSDRLFSKLYKFRIGNPIPGKDDACLYGKTHDDITSVPVTSKLYKLISPGAQHIGYFEGGKRKGAVFLLEKEERDDLAIDDNENKIEYKTSGVPFKNLPTFMTLLTYFRQTAFHEWNHENENDELDNQNPSIDYEYESIDGKKYRNYQVISKYYTSENMGPYKEPKYVISAEKDEKDNPKRFYINANGDRRPLGEVRFPLEQKNLGNNPILTSSGMTTVEIKQDGETVIHNQVTEGFVEATARAMVYAIAPETKDLDEGRYFEKVEMAKKVIESRDASQGVHGKGMTYAEFLTHSAVLKRELEGKEVTRTDGSKVDGLHYISDYADKVHERITPKRKKARVIEKAARFGIINNSVVSRLRKLDITGKASLTDDEIVILSSLLQEGGLKKKTVERFVGELVKCMEEEKQFFDGIPEKLGYREKTKSKYQLAERGKYVTGRKLGSQTVDEMKDVGTTDKENGEIVRQEKMLNQTKENQEIGE